MSSVDTSLDDLIRKNNSRDGRIIGGGSSSSTSSSSSSSRPGPTRRRFSSNRSATPYAPKKAVDQAPNASWLHGMFVDRALSMEADVKLYISNLDYGVSEEDLKLASREQPPVAGCSKGGNGFGRGDRLKRAHSELISAKDLDADLDKYRAQAMKTN